MESSIQQNTVVFLMVIGILIMLALAMAFVILFNFSNKKILTEQMRNQKLAYQHQEELLHSTIMTQEKERVRIAGELHDEIGSKLNVILLNSHRLRSFSKENEEMDLIMDEVNSVIHTTINTTRRISHDLLPPTLEEFGLLETIKELRDAINHSKQTFIELTVEENTKEIDDKLVELNLFRVFQELVNNSIRHGQASEIKLQLWLTAPLIKMIYKDNGKGLDMEQLKKRKGLGMKNIESRLRMIHATHQFDSSPGKGVQMQIELMNEKTIQAD